ncbi:MAG: SU10 major capsid protein, partial [Bacteroidales bacterium]
KAVSVSDTANAITSYGRNSELSYQMTKAGKEVLRDVEAANLSKTIGHIGKDGDPSEFTGFNFLCGPMYAVDPDTQAITHQGVSVLDINKPWFAISDIFEITTNLYLSGSKADKIMFHPRHINIFSDLLGFNEVAPNVYRLFDALDDKFNMKVFQIKDPVGRLYSLIPNRNMPETAVYFFNENDWTQMVLREPQRINLAKKGSYSSSMIETEIGLRHKHPHASGVLELKTVDFDAHLSVDVSSVALLPGEEAGFLIHLLHKDESPVQNMDFKIMLSDESIATLSSHAGQTSGAGSATFTLTGLKPGRVTVYVYGYDTNREFISNAITVDFILPELRIGVDEHTMAIGERISAQTRVLDPVNGFLAPAGTMVTWHTNSDQVVFVDNTTGAFIGQSPTIECKNGVSYVKFAAKLPGEYQIWSSYNGLLSSKITLTVTKAGLQFLWNTKSLFTAGFSTNEPMNVTISDRHGVALPDGTEVEWKVENGTRGTLSAKATTTTTGVSANNFTAEKAGDTYIVLTVHGDEFKHKISCVNPSVATSITPSNTMAVNQARDITTFITDAEGKPLNNVRVNWSAAPTSYVEFGSVSVTTGADGIATTKLTGKIQGKGIVETTINREQYKDTPFYVGTGAEITMTVNPNPTKIGELTGFQTTLVGADGFALSAENISFTSDPFLTDLSGMNGPTSPDGTLVSGFRPLSAEDSTIRASADRYDCIATVDLKFQEETYTYESSDPTKITIGLGGEHVFLTTVTNDKGDLVGNVELVYTMSDSNKATFVALNGSKTNGNGQSTIHITPGAKGLVDLSVKVKGNSNTHVFNLDIGDPKVTMEINPNPVNWGSNTSITGVVTGYGGEALDGLLVQFDTAPRLGTAISATTGIDGTYTKSWAPESNSDYEFNAYLDKAVHVVSPVIQLVVNG